MTTAEKEENSKNSSVLANAHSSESERPVLLPSSGESRALRTC